MRKRSAWRGLLNKTPGRGLIGQQLADEPAHSEGTDLPAARKARVSGIINPARGGFPLQRPRAGGDDRAGIRGASFGLVCAIAQLTAGLGAPAVKGSLDLARFFPSPLQPRRVAADILWPLTGSSAREERPGRAGGGNCRRANGEPGRVGTSRAAACLCFTEPGQYVSYWARVSRLGFAGEFSFILVFHLARRGKFFAWIALARIKI